MSFHNIFPIDSNPYGLSYSDWCVRWWQWLSCIPKPNNPALDWSGDNIYIRQHGSRVIFLCQTYEGVETTPVRRNILNKGTAVFMPIINWISIMHHDGETDNELLETARSKMDVVGPLEITIDGVTINRGLEKYRVESPFFEIDLPKNNLFGIPAGKRRAVSDGYWVFLHPIFKNVKLSSFSSCSSGVTKINVEYEFLTM